MIITTMVLVFLLLLCTAVLINVFSFITLNLEADALLEQIAVNYVLPDIEAENQSSEGQEINSETDLPDSSGVAGGEADTTIKYREGFDIYGRHKSLFSFLLPDIKQVDVMGAMYFTVTLDLSGHVVDMDVDRTREDERYVSDLTVSLFEENLRSGWRDRCKFLAVEDGDGHIIYIFLHRDRDVEDRWRVLWLTLLGCFIFQFVIFLLILTYSKVMLRPVVENIEKQKNFITNASHELKTPLAIIQANTEAMELYNGENKWTSNIKEQIGRLSIMLNNMLTLSRANEDNIQYETEEVDLTEITEELVKMYSESVAQRNLTLFQHIEQSAPVIINRMQMIQLVTILLDNAVKYAMDGTTVEIHLYSRDRNTVFETVNRCEELPQCEPERLFERFYRPDSSRYSSIPGNGIGLSAARAIASAYGGSITCKYEGKDFIRFTLLFRK